MFCLCENLFNLVLYIGWCVVIGDFNKMGNVIKYGDVRLMSVWINMMYCYGVFFYVICEEVCCFFIYLYWGVG